MDVYTCRQINFTPSGDQRALKVLQRIQLQTKDTLTESPRRPKLNTAPKIYASPTERLLIQ